jgi:hypothetical protein
MMLCVLLLLFFLQNFGSPAHNGTVPSNGGELEDLPVSTACMHSQTSLPEASVPPSVCGSDEIGRPVVAV